MIYAPLPPQAETVAVRHAIPADDLAAWLRDFRRDFPQQATPDDGALASAQRIVAAAQAGRPWTAIHSDARDAFRCDTDTASGILSLTLGLLDPDWTGHP